MATLKYRVNSGGALPDGQPHEDAAEASPGSAEASANARNQATELRKDEDLDQVQAERLIEEIEIAGSSCDPRPSAENKSAKDSDPGSMMPVAEDLDRLLPAVNSDPLGSERPTLDTHEGSGDGQQWILPSLFVVLTIGLGIFFLVNFPEVGDYSVEANGIGISAGTLRAESALDSATRSKLADLNRRVIFWMSRKDDGFDPHSVTLKRVREDLDLSSDQMLDSWGTPIRYEAADRSYTLRSSGPDKIFDTRDDLVELQPPVPSQI